MLGTFHIYTRQLSGVESLYTNKHNENKSDGEINVAVKGKGTWDYNIVDWNVKYICKIIVLTVANLNWL